MSWSYWNLVTSSTFYLVTLVSDNAVINDYVFQPKTTSKCRKMVS